MNVKDYFIYSFRMWKFDESALEELKEKEASSIWTSLSIAAIYGALFAIVFIIISLLTEINRSPSEFYGYLLGTVIGGVIVVPLIYLVITLWNYLWIKIFRGDKGFLKTLEIFMCIYMPILFFSLVSFILLLIILTIMFVLSANPAFVVFVLLFPYFVMWGLGIYAIFVIVKTFSVTHNMGIPRAFLAGFVSNMFIMFIFIVIGLILEYYI